MTRILILDGHPEKGSFCGALAGEYAENALTKGHEVRVQHLSELKFDPDFGTSDFKNAPELEPDLQKLWNDITWCEHVVIAYPLWWGGHPAKLKGLFDRVLLPGKAFKYISGKALPEKLLEGRTAEVLVTADTPGWIFRWLYGAGSRKQTEKQILSFCGLKPKGYHIFSPIRGSNDRARAKMLSRAGHLGRKAA
ncbi:NAD(P)H-dependent oxidoreductase [Roseibium sp. SCPC15]|uniref:NAD(P)H-dependent oxidoreductase n=1 Tax=Roseibium sp. SCP15 TaxID=3141376 RepID=UPI00333B624C